MVWCGVVNNVMAQVLDSKDMWLVEWCGVLLVNNTMAQVLDSKDMWLVEWCGVV